MTKLALVLGLIAISLPLVADDKAPLTGMWSCKMKVDGGAIPDTDGQMDLQQTGKDIKGTGTSAAGSAPMKGTLEESKVKLTVVTDAPWEFEGKLDGNKFGGTWGVPAAGVKGTYECAKPVKKDADSSAAASLTGLWKCVSKTPDGSGGGPFELDLTQKGDVVTGTGANAQGSLPGKGTFVGGKLLFKVEGGDNVFEFEGKLDGDKLSGTLNIPAMSVKLTFEGSKAAKAN